LSISSHLIPNAHRPQDPPPRNFSPIFARHGAK
jgi:hypothetical protein